MTDLQLFAQLQAWHEKGYMPELLPAIDGQRRGWRVRLDNEHGRVSSPLEDRVSIRFLTDIHLTPQSAIEAALEVVQP